MWPPRAGLQQISMALSASVPKGWAGWFSCHSGGAARIKVPGESAFLPRVHNGAGQGRARQGQSLWEVRGCPAFTW